MKRKYQSTRKFSTDTLITLSTRIVNFLFGMVISIIIARILGPEGKGIYSLAILVPTLAITFSNLGIGPATIFYIGKEKYDLKKILGNNLIFSLIIGALALLIGFIIILLTKGLFFKDVPISLLMTALILIPFSLSFTLLNQIILGMQQILKYNILEFSKQFFFLILVVIVLLGFRLELLGALLSHIFAILLAAFFSGIVVYKLVGGINYKLDKKYSKDLFFYGIKAHISNILSFLNYRADIFLISAFLNPAAVGYYALAVGIGEKLWLISTSASKVLFPRVASEKDSKRLKEFTPIVSRNVLFFTLIGAVFAYLLSEWIIVLLYSEAFLESIRPFQILLIGIIAASISRVLSHDIAGRGKVILNTYMAALTVIVNISLNILFIPRWGINGAAWASVISYSIHLIVKLLIYSKISGNPVSKIIFIQKDDLKLYKNLIFSLTKTGS